MAALIGFLVVGLAGCSNSGFTRDEAVANSHTSATCAFSVSYHDTDYLGTFPTVPFETAERIGTATIPPCNDTGHDYGGPVDTRAAYRVIGLDPSDAIAVRYDPDDALQLVAAQTGSGTPPAVQAYLAERNPDGSILVTPDRNLHDGDTVTVTLRGLDPGTEAMVAQCAPVQGSYACLTHPTLIPPATPPSSTLPSATEPGHASPPTAVPTAAMPSSTAPTSPGAVLRLTLMVHDPIQGELTLFTSNGDPVTDRRSPGGVSCHGADGQSCLIAVRGIHDGERVVRYASLRFATPTPPTPMGD